MEQGTQRTRYQRVSTGVYLYVKKQTKTGRATTMKNHYRVVRTVKGQKHEAYFTNKTKAIAFYKGIV